MDFIDPVDSHSRNRFKGARFVVDIDLGNNKKKFSLFSVTARSQNTDDNFSFKKFEE